MRRWGAGCAFLFLLLLPAPASAAADDFCQYGQATALLLIDRTTAFDDTDRSVFLGALDSLLLRLHAGDRLVAYTMTGAYTESRKVFDRCKPGCPDDSFLGSLLATCRPVLARAEYRAFVSTLAAELARLLREPEQTRLSDLFRTVADVTDTYAGDRDAKPLRQMFIFSDLLENSSYLPEREFRRLPAADVLRRLAQAGVAARLEGADVRVFGFGRDDAPSRPPLPNDQRQRVRDVWLRWLRTGGAASVEIGFR